MEESIKICVTCLSTNRRLFPVITITALLEEIHFEELKKSSGEVCWECWSILVKFYKFKKKAKIAQETLSQTTEHFNIKSLTTLSKTNIIFSDYDYSYNFDYETDLIVSIKQENSEQSDDDLNQMDDHFNLLDDTLEINESPITKPEANNYFYSEADIIENKHKINVLVKQENIFEDEQVIFNETHNSSGDTEESELSRTAKSQKKNVKTVKKRSRIAVKDTADKDFEDKFVQVVLTEEEMLERREEKRSQPAFRTLPFICDGCLLGFRKEDKYRFHMKQKHDEAIGNLACNICSIRFPHNLALSKHKIKHYVVFKCKLCRYQGNTLGSAVNHCKNKHAADKPDSIHCPQCKHVAKNSQDLERHMKSDHRFWCNECGEKFTLKKSLRTHLTSQQSSQGSQNIIIIETGHHQDQLNTRHSRTHGSTRAFKCEICKKGFKTKTQIESHMARHNDSIKKKLSYCKECNIQFKTLLIYRSHLKNSAKHSEGYQCPECDKRFKGKSYLKQHYDFHHLHRSRYKCEVCKKIFLSKSQLNIHKVGHMGKDRPRNYSCNICPKKFFNSKVLQNHQLTHTDERKFMCDHCGDTFKQRACLFTHTRLKHKGWRRRKRES